MQRREMPEMSETEISEALEYAAAYQGAFQFMQEMRAGVERNRSFSPGMIAAILRCKRKDERRFEEYASEDADAMRDPMDLRTLPEGTSHYAVRRDKLVFLRVDRVKDGTWAGWVFVKRQQGSEYVRVGKQPPGKLYAGGLREELRAVLDDPISGAIRYGREKGSCAVCGLSLTAEQSLKEGIGPVCRRRFYASV